MNKNLVKILDFILNRATEKEIIAIQAALERRMKGKMATGKSLSDIVSQSSEKMSEQMKVPVEQIHNSVKDMVARIIKQNVPEITDEQLGILLNEWVPGGKKQSHKGSSNLPPDVLMTMIEQFVAFSLGQMPKEEEVTLRREMPAWPEKYWHAFPEPIQVVISSFLKGNMNEKNFWQDIHRFLG